MTTVEKEQLLEWDALTQLRVLIQKSEDRDPHPEPLTARYRYIPPESEWTPVDRAIYGVSNHFTIEVEEAEALRLDAIKYSFNHHYNTNRFYRTLCEQREVTPDDIETLEDLNKIPLVPDRIFKGCRGPEEFVSYLVSICSDEVAFPPRGEVSGSYDEQIEKLEKDCGIEVVYTSGTSGRFSFIPKDPITWRRASHAYALSVISMPPLPHRVPIEHVGNRSQILLGPNPTKTHVFVGRAGHILFALTDSSNIHPAIDREINIASLVAARQPVKGLKEKLRMAAMRRASEKVGAGIIQTIESLQENGKAATIGGAPYMMNRVLNRMEKMGKKLELGDMWAVRSGGGWKLQENVRLPEDEHRKRIVALLGVPDSNLRDNYGMTECSITCGASCEGHYKHIPYAVLHPLVLGDDLEPVGYGEYGRFAFLDPISHGYPGFILSGDRVMMLEHCPACDRPGPVLYPEVTRMQGVEDRGCAGVVRQLVTQMG